MTETDFSAWVGRRETRADMIAPGPVTRLAATFDRDDPPPKAGDALPPGWHWLYFLGASRQSLLGADGHTTRGEFLPPVDLPRRMWAGGRIGFHADLRIGEPVERESEIVSITPKRGRAGALVFITVRHRVSGPAGLAVEEEHDIVFREPPRPDAPPPIPPRPPGDGAWERIVHPDPVLLFRFSALTFNGHRIHYDHPYATGVEGYPGLVVHGPLIALLLLDLLRRRSPSRPTFFDYRAYAPLFDDAPFALRGAPSGDGAATLWAARPDGGLAMQGTATLGDGA